MLTKLSETLDQGVLKTSDIEPLVWGWTRIGGVRSIVLLDMGLGTTTSLDSIKYPVPRDREQPGLERGARSESIQVTIGLDEDLLVHIVGQRAIVKLLPAVAIHCHPMSPHQRGECCSILAALNQPDDVVIGVHTTRPLGFLRNEG